MYARVARFEGDKETIDRMVEEITKDSDQGPPEGVPAKGFQVLRSLDGGAVYAIGLFETEDDLRTGDATLNSMSPSEDVQSSIRRTNLDLTEVALELSSDD